MSTRINVVEYDDQWPITFENLRHNIWSELKHIAMGIEHVGSTSVVGLAAKPVIDMDIVVSTQESLSIAMQALDRLGYIPLGNMGVPGREAFKRPEGSAKHNLYVCLQNSTAFKNHILFRDALRKDPSIRAKYAELKLYLAEKFAGDTDQYCEAKTGFILEVLKTQGLTDAELAEVADSNK